MNNRKVLGSILASSWMFCGVGIAKPAGAVPLLLDRAVQAKILTVENERAFDLVINNRTGEDVAFEWNLGDGRNGFEKFPPGAALQSRGQDGQLLSLRAQDKAGWWYPAKLSANLFPFQMQTVQVPKLGRKTIRMTYREILPLAQLSAKEPIARIRMMLVLLVKDAKSQPFRVEVVSEWREAK